ncbi:MAG: hypothetical protein WCP55_14465 [Lentisphaerota bacterium]
MKIAEKNSANGLKDGSIDSIVDAISEHVEKSENYEFVRIMEQYSKMDAATMKKLMRYAEKVVTLKTLNS